MQSILPENVFQKLNLDIKDNTNKNKTDSKASTPPNPQEFQENENNEKYVSYYFPNINGLNSIDENIFNIDIPKKNINENDKKEEEENKNIIKDNKSNLDISNNLKKKYNKNIFCIEKEKSHKNDIKQIGNNNNNKSIYNLYQNKKLNNNSLAFEKFIEKINNENIFNKKRNIKKNIKKKIKKNLLKEKKNDLINKKNNISNFEIGNYNNMEINKNIFQGNRDLYQENSSAFKLCSNNNNFMNFFPNKPQNQRPNVINSSIININSTQKNNNNIPNILFNDKINSNYNINNNNYKYNYNNIPNIINEKECLPKAPNISYNNEENRESYSFTPQIFESQNSSIMIGGIEYTTLLVPKKYLGKIRAKMFG